MDIRHLIVATDFSNTAELALKAGASMGRKYGARVTLVHAVGTQALDLGDLVQPIVSLAELEEAVHTKLDQLVETHLQGVDSKTMLLRGPSPSIALVDMLEDVKPDLLVIGSQGRTGLSRLLLGSTAEVVVRHAHCPVLTIPAAQD